MNDALLFICGLITVSLLIWVWMAFEHGKGEDGISMGAVFAGFDIAFRGFVSFFILMFIWMPWVI